MFNWKRTQQVFGETVREIGILLFVFAPLDAAFAEGRADLDFVTTTVLVAIGLIASGILLETDE